MIAITKALLKAQPEMGNAIKGTQNDFTKKKYADLNAVRDAIIPILNKYLIDKKKKTELTEKREKRTLSQNNYLHLIISWFCIETGRVVPVGDSNLDVERLANMQQLIELAENIIGDISNVADEYKDSYCASEKRIGNLADEFMKDLKSF